MGYPTFRNPAVDLAEMLAEADLDAVRNALIKESVIRDAMAQTGEDRKAVTDMIEAMESMDQEAVLDLTEGEPTTLADALSRYVDLLEAGDPDPERIARELTTLLNYPWPDGVVPSNAVLKLDNPDDQTLIISVGGVEVATANHDEHGWAGMEVAQRAAEGVHRAVLAAVRAQP